MKVLRDNINAMDPQAHKVDRGSKVALLDLSQKMDEENHDNCSSS